MPYDYGGVMSWGNVLTTDTYVYSISEVILAMEENQDKYITELVSFWLFLPLLPGRDYS